GRRSESAEGRDSRTRPGADVDRDQLTEAVGSGSERDRLSGLAGNGRRIWIRAVAGDLRPSRRRASRRQASDQSDLHPGVVASGGGRFNHNRGRSAVDRFVGEEKSEVDQGRGRCLGLFASSFFVSPFFVSPGLAPEAGFSSLISSVPRIFTSDVKRR